MALKYGRTLRARSFARRILEDATNSIAFVICMVDCTDLIRRLMSFMFPDAIVQSLPAVFNARKGTFS